MSFRRAHRIIQVAAACAVAALCSQCHAGLLKAFKRPKAVASDKALYLFAKVTGTQESLSVCLRKEGDGKWEELSELRADYSSVLHFDGKLYLFLPRTVTELDADTCRKTRETRWPFNWRVQSAELARGILTVYGVGGDGELYSARARMAPSPAKRDKKSKRPADAAGPGGTTEPKSVAPPKRTTEPKSAAPPKRTTEPAGVRPGGRVNLLAGEWEEGPLATEGQGACVDVRTLRVSDTLWLFWLVREAGRGDVLKAAVLGKDGLGRTDDVAASPGKLEFTVTEFDKQPMVIYATLPARLTGKTRLEYRTRGRERWLPFQVAEDVSNPFGEETHSLSAVSFDGKVHLFLGTDCRVLTSAYDGTKWSAVRTVLSDPSFDLAIQNSVLLTAAMVAGLLCLAASVVRSRFLPRRAAIAGVEYVLASWPRRGAAYACDMIIAVAAVNVMLSLAGTEGSTSRFAVALFCFELFYFSVLEARSGKTIGKRLFGLIVVSRNGGYPSGSEALLRNVLRALGDLAMPVGWLVGSIVMLNTRGSQRIGDLASGTYVVREPIKE